jgi:UDP-N-acetyl-D-glucosamine dehydrogenase
MEFKSVGIIGLGYVGLPLAIRCAEIGYGVLGFDIDEVKVNMIQEGESYIKHITSGDIAKALSLGFKSTTDFSKISEVDAVIICVPTPLNKYREPDLSYIINTLDTILPYLKKGQILSLESTTYPGTTDEEIVPRVEKQDPGNVNYTTATIPKVVGGYTNRCLKAGVELYSKIVNQVVPVSSTRVAEMVKLLENIHRSVNIGLVNEMKIIADKMDIDIHEVVEAAATKPFGFTPYYPGPGLGGHCIPIDPFYLTWKAKEFGLHTRFIELAGEINREMPEWVVNKIALGLNLHKKAVRDSKILIVGIAYKKNIDDMRESPSVEVMEKLILLGAKVQYHDDFIPEFPHMRNHYMPLKNTAIHNNIIADFDCVVIMTDHDYINYDGIIESAKLVIDTRGRFKNNKSEKLIRA